MNRKFKAYFAVWAILLILFNVVAFVIPGSDSAPKYDASFFVGYDFITLAFAGQLVASYFALKAENKTKLFYNIPMIRVSFTGLILTGIIGACCMAIPGVPYWLGIVLCVVVLGFTAIAVIKARAASDIVENVDQKVKAKTFFIKSLTVDAESLLARAATPEAKEACKKVVEAIRFSDPMSNDALAGIESQITLKFNEFSNAMTSGAENVSTLADELVVLIGDRNKKCKLLK